MPYNYFTTQLYRFYLFLLNKSFLPTCSYVRDEYGSFLFKVFSENREIIRLDRIPPLLINTLILIEDKRFYSHFGIDLIAIARAFSVNFKSGKLIQGGSTITQQLVRNAFLTKRKIILRKITECIIALLYEMKHTKNRILEDYLNTIFFGESIYGIKNATKTFFQKKVEHLRVEEIALLVGMIKSPNYYSPNNNRRCEERKNFVLFKMKEANLISQQQYDTSHATIISFTSTARRITKAPFVRDHIKDILSREFNRYFPQQKLIIESTIDQTIQNCIEEALSEFDEPLNSNISMCVIEPKTGKIKGMAGSSNYNYLKFNSVVNGSIQPGSTLKPFIYAEALAEGFNPSDEFESKELNIPLRNGRTWKVRNWQNTYRGRLNLRDALIYSDNTVFAQLIQEIDLAKLSKFLNSVGILISKPTLSLATGAMRGGVSPLSLSGAYSTFANDGMYIKPRILKRLYTERRELIYENDRKPVRVLDRSIAQVVNDTLRDVIKLGTGYHPDLIAFAGKTGTSSSGSLLSIYDDQLLATVWVGFDPTKFRSAQEYYDKGYGPKNVFSRFIRKLTHMNLFKTHDLSVF